MNLEDVLMGGSSRVKIYEEILCQAFSDIIKDLTSLRSKAKMGGEIAQNFFNQLKTALDNGVACIVLARTGLVVPLMTINRSIFESMISMYWASLNDENAMIIIEARKCELLRIMRNNLRDGRAQIVNKKMARTKLTASLIIQ